MRSLELFVISSDILVLSLLLAVIYDSRDIWFIFKIMLIYLDNLHCQNKDIIRTDVCASK